MAADVMAGAKENGGCCHAGTLFTKLKQNDHLQMSTKNLEAAQLNCRCAEMEDAAENFPKLGRQRPIQVVTIFAKGDDKRHLLDCPDLISVLELNPRENLVTQWNALGLKENKPDLILTKLHKALGCRTFEPEANLIMKNYEELRQQYDKLFERLELIPIKTEYILTNRFRMQDLIEKVCDAVNTTLNCPETEKNGNETKNLRKSLQTPIETGMKCVYTDSEIPDGIVCLKPQSTKIEASHDVASKHSDDGVLPPFPLVVKPSSTSMKNMALVLDSAALRHFRSDLNSSVVVEEYIPHSDTILKVYVIGKEIFIIRRPSLPDLVEHHKEALKEFGKKVLGQFIPLKESKAGGYIVFQSDKITKRHEQYSSGILEDYANLNHDVFRLLTQSLARELKVDLFGFDVLSSQSDLLYVIDVNVLPGYKGVPSSKRKLCEWLAYLASRKAFKEDCFRLMPQDLLEMSLFHNDEWRRKRVSVETLEVRQITTNRIFQVKFKETSDRPDLKVCHTLVKFRPMHTPRRFISDKDHFVSNLCSKLYDLGMGPYYIKDVSAVYFDKRRHIGLVREWIEGKPLHYYLTRADDIGSLDEVFRNLGQMLARFHLLIENEEIRRDILDHHFPGAQSAPVIFRLLEQWRRDAVLSLLSSQLEKTQSWNQLFHWVLDASKNVVSTVSDILNRLKTEEAFKLIFGHFDCNTSNIIVCGGLEKADVVLIDEEWAGPNVAVYDFAKFVTSSSLMILRQTTSMTEAGLRSAVRLMAESYLMMMRRRGGQSDSESSVFSVDAFVSDIWTFVPIVALSNCFSNLIHASKEGQLSTDIDEDEKLTRKEGTFNWLRHARDHCLIYLKSKRPPESHTK